MFIRIKKKNIMDTLISNFRNQNTNVTTKASYFYSLVDIIEQVVIGFEQSIFGTINDIRLIHLSNRKVHLKKSTT